MCPPPRGLNTISRAIDGDSFNTLVICFDGLAKWAAGVLRGIRNRGHTQMRTYNLRFTR